MKKKLTALLLIGIICLSLTACGESSVRTSQNDSSFEKAFTNFTIRYPITQITRDMLIEFNGKIYTIQYLNNVNEANVELEIQAKEVTH